MNSPHQSVLAISRHLSAAIKSLSALNESLLPGHVPAAPRVIKQRAKPRPKAPAPSNRIAHLMPVNGTSRLPARLAKRVKAVMKPRKPRHMTPQDEHDTVLLLTKTNLSVDAIAKLMGRTRAAIYGLRDRKGLKVHLGSPELMAGVRRLHGPKKTRRRAHRAPVHRASVRQIAPAPVAESVLQPVAQTPEPTLAATT